MGIPAMAAKLIQSLFNWFGLEVIRRTALPIEASEADRRIVARVRPYTMTSSDRLWALIQSVRYVVESAVPGDFVECGVWRGGSAMAMAMTLSECGRSDRRIWLYDTFSGMTGPSDVDVEAYSGRTARKALQSTRKKTGSSVWCLASKKEVQANLRTINYPAENFRIVEGDVVETLRRDIPSEIALLRLDTDWYESTLAELEYLYPRVSRGGVCIIDDYGYWRGAKKAVDEYFQTHGIHVLLNKIDECGRIFVKL
jgi:hypothetical protein